MEHPVDFLKLQMLDKTMINELIGRNYETSYRDFLLLLLESDLRPSNNVFFAATTFFGYLIVVRNYIPEYDFINQVKTHFL